MKAIKILSIVLALLMVGMALISCGGPKEEETTTEAGGNVAKEPLNVNIIVRESLGGENKYASNEITGYDYIGTTVTPLAILEEFMGFEYEIEITYDDEGKLAKVGDLEAKDGHLWLWSLAKAPKDASMAEAMDANLDEYNDISAGDTIVIYLS
jgi:hypothetical protein